MRPFSVAKWLLNHDHENPSPSLASYKSIVPRDISESLFHLLIDLAGCLRAMRRSVFASKEVRINHKLALVRDSLPSCRFENIPSYFANEATDKNEMENGNATECV